MIAGFSGYPVEGKGMDCSFNLELWKKVLIQRRINNYYSRRWCAGYIHESGRLYNKNFSY